MGTGSNDAGRDTDSSSVRSVRVPARIGLLGNPSDGFGGRVIAAAIDDVAATVIADPALRWEVHSSAGTSTASDRIEHYAERLDDLDDGAELLAAALLRLSAHEAWPADALPRRLSFSTDIPRQVGLSGSSAIVLGALRALAPALSRPLLAAEFAQLALEAETDVLGWTAGPQDRVIQAHGGVLDMDFAGGWAAPRWRRLPSDALPPLVVAWQNGPGEASHEVHRAVAARQGGRDPAVAETMRAFAALATAGSASLSDGTATQIWASLFDEAWRLRTELWEMTDGDRALVELAADHGLGATITGSGGAIVATPHPTAHASPGTNRSSRCKGEAPARAQPAIDRFIAAAQATGMTARRPSIAPALAKPPAIESGWRDAPPTRTGS